MKFKSKHIDTDRILSVSAMVIGVGSLFVILYQTHLMRQSQHASVMPYLMIGFTSNSGGIHVNLRNAGIGPALITLGALVQVLRHRSDVGQLLAQAREGRVARVHRASPRVGPGTPGP